MAVKWGIMSTAHINRLFLAGARESTDTQILAVASRDVPAPTRYAADNGIERAYGSYDALLADPDVEAVYISLPNSLHIEWTHHARSRPASTSCARSHSADAPPKSNEPSTSPSATTGC